MTRLMFFYGTLMKGTDSIRSSVPEHLGMRFVGKAQLRGDLHAVYSGAFPAYMEGEGTITGEVWELPDDPAAVQACYSRLDSIEGYREDRPETSMYLRVERPLLDDGEGRTVQTYLWNHGRDGLTPIPGGDWLAFERAQRARERGQGFHRYATELADA